MGTSVAAWLAGGRDLEYATAGKPDCYRKWGPERVFLVKRIM
jgi:hypothetical protein